MYYIQSKHYSMEILTYYLPISHQQFGGNTRKLDVIFLQITNNFLRNKQQSLQIFNLDCSVLFHFFCLLRTRFSDKLNTLTLTMCLLDLESIQKTVYCEKQSLRSFKLCMWRKNDAGMRVNNLLLHIHLSN